MNTLKIEIHLATAPFRNVGYVDAFAILGLRPEFFLDPRLREVYTGCIEAYKEHGDVTSELVNPFLSSDIDDQQMNNATELYDVDNHKYLSHLITCGRVREVLRVAP